MTHNKNRVYPGSYGLLRKSEIIPITDFGTGQEATIAFIQGEGRVVQRLADLGLTPGTTVTLRRKISLNGPVEIEVRRTRLAVEPAIASNIFIGPARAGEA